MHRFFCPELEIKGSAIFQLNTPKEVHHLKNVLRLKPADQIAVFNSRGKEAVGTILSFNDNAVEVRVDYLRPEQDEKRTTIILACAIPKKAKFETIIEKCTELGVDEIIPMLTQRTIVKVKGEDIKKKTTRYQTVAINAAKQSNRTTVPHIHPAQNFKEALKALTDEGLGLIPCLLEGERKGIGEIFRALKTPKRIIFFIGPEGDFTKEEIALAVQAGCRPVSLGDTVLKVDTAAIGAVSFARLYFSQDNDE